MDVLLNPTFWLLATACIIAMRAPMPWPQTTRFGVLSLVVIGVAFDWRASLLMLAIGLAVWLGLHRIGETGAASSGGTSLCLLAVLFAPSGVFVLYKLVQTNGDASGLPYMLLATLSFSYVFLRIIEVIRVVSASRVRLLRPLALVGYLFPFHMLISGPLNVYAHHLKMDDEEWKPLTLVEAAKGVWLVVTGLFLKVVLAEGGRTFIWGTEAIAVESWTDAAMVHAYVLFDFGGYSVMAFGLGRLLGVPTPLNFRRPFLAGSVSEYWRRWHISLGDWVRRNLFTPLQVRLVRRLGSQHAVTVGVLSLVVCFAGVGVWHRFNSRYLVWGIGIGALMALEKMAASVWMRQSWSFFVMTAGWMYVWEESTQ